MILSVLYSNEKRTYHEHPLAFRNHLHMPLHPRSPFPSFFLLAQHSRTVSSESISIFVVGSHLLLLRLLFSPIFASPSPPLLFPFVPPPLPFRLSSLPPLFRLPSRPQFAGSRLGCPPVELHSDEYRDDHRFDWSSLGSVTFGALKSRKIEGLAQACLLPTKFFYSTQRLLSSKRRTGPDPSPTLWHPLT